MVPDAEPTYVTSKNFDDDLLQAAKDGVDLTREFLGSVSGDEARVYLLEAGGSDNAYTSLVDDMCDWMEMTGWSQCGESEVSSAQNGGGQYYLSGVADCVCGEHLAARRFLRRIAATSRR